jgi:hypothetical protein
MLVSANAAAPPLPPALELLAPPAPPAPPAPDEAADELALLAEVAEVDDALVDDELAPPPVPPVELLEQARTIRDEPARAATTRRKERMRAS